MSPPSEAASWGWGFPGIGWIAGWALIRNFHRSAPVRSEMARNLPSHEPAYTVPFATMGVAVTASPAGTNQRRESVVTELSVREVWPWNARATVRPNVGQTRPDRREGAPAAPRSCPDAPAAGGAQPAATSSATTASDASSFGRGLIRWSPALVGSGASVTATAWPA